MTSHSCGFGIVVPWMNRAVESQLPRLVGPGISLHWARVSPRVSPESPTDETYLEDMVDELPTAVRSLAPSDLHRVVFACTSASMKDLLTAADFEVVTTMACLVEELVQRGFHRPILVTPYSEELTARLAERLSSEGSPPAELLLIRPFGEFRDTSVDEIVATIETSTAFDADCVVVSCTALHTWGLKERLVDAGIRLPLITSISAIAGFVTRRQAECLAGDGGHMSHNV